MGDGGWMSPTHHDPSLQRGQEATDFDIGGSLPPPICHTKGQSAEKECGGGRRAHSEQGRHVN